MEQTALCSFLKSSEKISVFPLLKEVNPFLPNHISMHRENMRKRKVSCLARCKNITMGRYELSGNLP